MLISQRALYTFAQLSVLFSVSFSLRATSLEEPRFNIFLTQEKITPKERFGTFKLKRRVKKVCYPNQIDRVGAREQIYRFPRCEIELVVKRGEEGWSFEGPKTDNVFVHIDISKFGQKYFYGLGTQFTHHNLNGKKFPIISEEQGNGRGLQPLSFLQFLFANGLQGHDASTYSANSLVLTRDARAYFVPSYHYMKIDFTHPEKFRISHLGTRFDLKYAKANSIRDVLSETRKWLGQQPRLPDWVHKGPMLGFMNIGDKSIWERLGSLMEAGVPVASLWAQDWVGTRSTQFGTRLIWDWRRDETHYPNWNERVAELKEKGIKILSYFNPFLTQRPNSGAGVSMYDEAMDKGFILDEKVRMGGFKAQLIDLFNPEARSWYKDQIKNAVQETKVDGWMADFGEAYPLSLAKPAAHHLYIEEWNKLNKEIVDELSSQRGRPLVSFNRAGTWTSAPNTSLFWLGDQTSTYDEKDGMKSALRGLVSSGLSSIAYNHSDIGGYVSIKIPFLRDIKREQKLLEHWMQMNAFSMVFRTHLGLKPQMAHQVDTNEQTISAFKKWSQVFAGLFNYRKKLIEEYEKTGLPPVRSMFLEFPNDSKAYGLPDQYMFGPNFLVAPLFSDSPRVRRVYLPEGNWRDYWTSEIYRSNGEFLEFSNPDQIIVLQRDGL